MNVNGGLFSHSTYSLKAVKKLWNDCSERRRSLLWRDTKISAFECIHGYPANLENPNTFSEKLLKRILDFNDPLYHVYGVKLFAQYFVQARAIKGLKLPQRLKVVNNLQESDFIEMPESFVVKSSFGSGLNEIVRDKASLDVDAVIKKFNEKITKVRNAQNRACRSNVIIFEEFIGDPKMGVPEDYKFHCFNGVAGDFTCFIQVDSNRFGDHRQTIFYQKFQTIEMTFGGQVKHEFPPPAPLEIDGMLRICRELSRGFDYIRIDLFNTSNGIYFGEITPFHQGAMAPISPYEWELRLGHIWDQNSITYNPFASIL